MVDTVIILNEELCSMSLAFEKAGYKILATCEADRKSRDIHKKYMKTKVIYEDMTKTDICSLPDSDVIAGKLEIHDNNDCKRGANNNVIRKRELVSVFLEVVNRKTPKAILCEANVNAANTKTFYDFIAELSQFYKVSYKVYNVNDVINVPVNERKIYIIGVRKDISKDYNFIKGDKYKKDSKLEILECKNVDKWYFNVNYNQIKNLYKKDEVKWGSFIVGMIMDMLNVRI